jgi:hypothetical protein
MKFCGTLIAIALAWFAYAYFHRPIKYPSGILVSSDPEQTNLSESAAPIEQGAFHLKPLAHFELDARLLHRKIYRWDRQSKLAPLDLAVGWGPMSDQAILDRLRISQSMRFFWYEYQQPPIAKEEIIRTPQTCTSFRQRRRSHRNANRCALAHSFICGENWWKRPDLTWARGAAH